ncbi:hypothetical protein Q2K19_13470 [Micromonospora soli]|uniref:hypothetical protein n=1 Tax=Micromonospora sp. NBRC 110009 TaxID=3061627 RepID=UPI00267184E3|nr:hypothetical protein [Micromonospora sp. NBRC 110009]WKU01401.1 hypothetical protein Q2K19_13470 [Micromonospora sp. NBRC 110009]
MGITEIRVHGVADRGPEAMLNRPIVSRVAGDREAGFYRVPPGFGNPHGVADTTLEAYRWSGLTGGTATRTFSLVLLLPFMLANTAIWMLPPAGRGGAAGKALCRLLAATLTTMYVLSIVGAALDLVAWQCAEYARCLEGRRGISWLGGVPPGRRLAIAALLPILGIALVWRLSGRTWQRPEDTTTLPPGLGAGRLDAPAFWDNRALLLRLRSLHVVISLATLDLALLLAVVPRNGIPGHALLVGSAGLLAAALVVLCLPQLERRPAARWSRRAGRLLRWAAITLTGLTLAYAAAPRAPWSAVGNLPGYDVLVAGLFTGQVGLLVALAALVLARRSVRGRGALLGLAAPLVVSVAIGLAVSYSSGLSYGVAEYLDRGSHPTPARPLPPGAPPLSPPVAYRWAALGFSAALLFAVAVTVLVGRYQRIRHRQAADDFVQREFPEAPRAAPERVRAVADKIIRARLADRLGPLLLAAYALLAALALAAAGSSALGHGPEDVAQRLGGQSLARPVIFVTDLGGLLVGLFAVALFGAGLFAYRSEAMRMVSVLWELATFWPRAAHPLAAPCYAVRAVPDLIRRIVHLTAGGDAVVLSGQSHGSVLAAATVLQLPESARARVALLTYGTPLGRLSSRTFAAYIGPDVLREIGDRLDWRWINLWRRTDPVGGPVFGAEARNRDDPHARVDREVRDPAGLLIPPGDTVPPKIGGHRFTPDDFDWAVHELVGRLHPAGPGDGGLRG